MASQDVETEAARLRAEIDRHNRLYYVEAAPEISDKEFDLLLKSLEAIEAAHPELITPDSPTQRVGGQPLEGFRTVQHAIPMLSIDNTYTFDGVREWDARIRRGLEPGEPVRYVVELKVDGVAASLRYEQGRLVLGSTRGDGYRGDDITQNLRTVRGIPLHLSNGPPDLVEVLGEVYMPNAELVRLNDLRRANGEPPFANPRNATAGSLKQLDPRICAQRRLRFAAHGLGLTVGLERKFYSEILQDFKAWGLPTTSGTTVLDSIEAVIDHAQEWAERRNQLDFQTDGLVVKVDDLHQRERLGARSKSPRWMVAYKHEAEQALTRIEGITVQVGKTGRLTPVAELTPVLLAGTTVRRASLHNADEIARKDVRIGDTVLIQKAGEIIPQVVRVEPEARTGSEIPYQFPDHCPSCGAPVERVEGLVDLRCSNTPSGCAARLKEWVRYFASRSAMDIDGLGEKLIDQLVDQELVRSLADLYRLDEDTLAGLERMGKKSATNLVQSLQASRSRPLDRFLTGLAIRHVGTRVAEILAERFGTLEAIRVASIDDLAATPGIGPIVATSVHDFFQDPPHHRQIDDLLSVGVHPTPVTAPDPSARALLPLAGQTFVITGTLPKRSRAEAEAMIRQAGGKATSSVSKSTTFVVAGDDPGSKLERAHQLQIPVIDEAQLELLARGESI